MSEILFMAGDVPVRAGHALIGFGALALLLLLTIAIVIARLGPQRCRGRDGAGVARRRA